jgi:hypothetical protein
MDTVFQQSSSPFPATDTLPSAGISDGDPRAAAVGAIDSGSGGALSAGNALFGTPSGVPGRVGLGPSAGLAFLAGLVPSRQTAAAPAPAPRPTTAPSLGQIPLSFEANQGQTDSQVRFLAHGQGYTAFLTATEAVFAATPPSTTSATPGASSPPPVVRLQLEGANPAAQVVGLDRLPGTVNYFLGSDPTQWHTRIPTYGQVEYQQVYPGIDLVYHGSGGSSRVEYDFVVAPGADSGVIRMHFAGADQVSLDAQSNLVVTAGDTRLVQHRPTVYQDAAGVRTPVTSQFILDGQDAGFQVGAHDPGRPLVIDPVLSYSTYFGGDGLEWGDAVAVDPAGNLYLGGRVDNSLTFPLQNPIQPSPGGGQDGFVMKLSADGSTLLYSTYLGGRFADQVAGIAVDADGSAYVTGVTASDNFPTFNALQPTQGGGIFGDAFVTRFTPDGSGLVFSTYLGGSRSDLGYGIALDAAGNAYVTGATQSDDFPTVNALQPNRVGTTDVFVAALTADCSSLIYSTYLGGHGENDQAIVGSHGHFGAIAVDALGDAYITGKTNAPDFPTVNAVQPTLSGGFDAFVTVLSPDGSTVYSSTYLGGSGNESAFGIAVDGDGYIYVAGQTDSRDFPTANPLQPSYGGGLSNGWLTKLTPDASAVVYSTYFGGSGFDIIDGLALDPWNDVVLVGETGSRNLPTANPIQGSYQGGFSDAFVAKVDASGASLIYSTYLGGSDEDRGWGVAVDAAGSAYVTGETHSTDFPTVNALQGSNGGGAYDAFITKISDM